ncbi:hypothetical protein [Paenibacillus solani]|nr:hypothetical protein [Paenibacillus solani]
MGIWIVILLYLVLLGIGIYQDSLTIRTTVLMTGITAMIVTILYWIPKLFTYLNRRLYEKLRRMMK